MTNPYQGIAMYPEGPPAETASTARYLLQEADKMAAAPFQNIRMNDWYSPRRAFTDAALISYEPTNRNSGRGTYDLLRRENSAFSHLQGLDVSSALTTMARTIDYSLRR